ncbi:MAG: hypothetical protein RSA91_01855 [Bacilli bacterium]
MIIFFIENKIFNMGVFIICLFLLMSGFCFLKNKFKLAYSFYFVAFGIMVGIGNLTLKTLNPSSEMLIDEIVKERPLLTKEELKNLSNKNLEKILLKINEEKEAQNMRAITEKIDIDDIESMRAIPQRIEFY